MMTGPKMKALEARMNARLEALAEENLRLKRSTRRYARWSMMFVAVACVGVLSYARAIDPLTDTGTTAPAAAGEVKTEFSEQAVISAGEFSSNFEGLVLKTNELVTQVNTNTSQIRNTPYTSANGTVFTFATDFGPVTSLTLQPGEWLCHYNLQATNGSSAASEFNIAAVLSTSLNSASGDKLSSAGYSAVKGDIRTGPETSSVSSYALFDGITTPTTLYLKASGGGAVQLISADVLCHELARP